MKHITKMALFASSILTILPIYPAIAQNSSGESSQESEAGIGDIIVTAQKRSESINNVGMAISAFSEDHLRNLGIKDPKDLVRVIPGFSYSISQKGAPVYTLRGVGFYEETLAASPAVSVYVDEIGYSFPILAKAASLDLERVEVLKGPQGTLYGQNSTGGAINYIAAKPTSDFMAGMNLSYGRYGALSVDGYVSGPISDDIRVRLSAAADEGGAWQHSFTRKDRNGAADVLKARLLTEITPTDRLKITINLNGWRDRSDAIAAALHRLTAQTPSRLTPVLLGQQLAPNKPGVADWNPESEQRIDEKFWQAALRADYELTDSLTLTSLTSYQHFAQDDFRDTDGSNISEYAVQQQGKVKSFSQELRVSGTFLEERVNWLVGGYYSHDKTSENILTFQTLSTSGGAFVGLGLPRYGPVGVKTFQGVKTKAVFGNVDFKVTDAITVHAGARRTKTTNDYNSCTYDTDGVFDAGILILLRRVNPGAAPVGANGCFTVLNSQMFGEVVDKLSEKNTSWRVGVDYKPANHTLLYATLSKGYKSGSFPTLLAAVQVADAPVTQESVLAYEAGFKTDLGSRFVQLNGAVFLYDYKNKQLRGRLLDPLRVFGAVEALVNVPKSQVKGAEISANLQPVQGLTLNGGLTYLDSKVKGTFNNYNPFGAPANFAGEAFPFTPKWSLQGSFEYAFPVNERMEAFFGANATYQSDTVGAFGRNAPVTPYPNSLINIDGYALIDAQIGVRSPDHKWQAMIWGKNITNKYYWTDVFRQIDNLSRHVGSPATYGIRFGYEF